MMPSAANVGSRSCTHVRAHKIRQNIQGHRGANISEYSTLIILQLATATRGLYGLMLSLLELLDPESGNSVCAAWQPFLQKFDGCEMYV
jgi:hypothetical protein